MRIPKRFKLLGKTIEVKYDPEIFHREDKHGAASYRQDEIILQPKCEGIDFTQSNVEQSFLHELVHYICYYAGNVIQHKLGDEYLHRNEAFVDLFAGLLHQALESFEFEESQEIKDLRGLVSGSGGTTMSAAHASDASANQAITMRKGDKR